MSNASFISCADWQQQLVVRRQAILSRAATERNILNTLIIENPNTPFPTTINEQGEKVVDFNKRRYSYLGNDLPVSDVQNRRKYEALKCLPYANGVQGKYQTKYKILPKRYAYRIYSCEQIRSEARETHTFQLPGRGNLQGKRKIQFRTKIPFFPLNGVGPGSSSNSDGTGNYSTAKSGTINLSR